jgi:uncharacterized integral membrane protein
MKSAKSILSLALLLAAFTLQAQNDVEMADSMRAEGKIYVVVAVILTVLTGLIVYLFLLDRKVKKLEKMLAEKSTPSR